MNTVQPTTTRVETKVAPKPRHWALDPRAGRFLLPAAGALIIGLDWLLFSGDAATLGLTIPVLMVVGFLLGGGGTFFLQRKFGGDSTLVASLKALIAGIVVGVPWPIAGTLVGGWVLVMSGLGKSRTGEPNDLRK